MKKNGLLVAMLALLLVATVSCDKTTPVPFVSPIGFETVTLGEMGYLKESSFNEDGLLCENNYNAEWNAWKGFACSSLVDSVTSGYTNELSVSAGKAYLGQKFAVVYEDSAVCKFSNNGEYKIKGLYVTNSTYAYLDMKNGSAYSKKFVAGDWVLYILNGLVETSQTTIEKIKKMLQLKDETEIKMKEVLGASYNHDLLQLMFTLPYLKIELLEKGNLAHRQTASTWLKKLSEAGILSPQKIGRTNYFVNENLIKIFSE
jgi:hypothetical protein